MRKVVGGIAGPRLFAVLCLSSWTALGGLPAGGAELIAVHSGKCLSTAGDLRDGAPLIQEDCDGTPAQQFRVEASGDAQRILNLQSGKCLDVAEASLVPGAPVILHRCGAGDHQRWRTLEVPGGQVRITAAHSGMSLDVAGGSSSNGARLIQWHSGTSDNQRFFVADEGAAAAGVAEQNRSCGDAARFDARVTTVGGRWRAENGSRRVYDGTNMMDAVQAALNSLTPARTRKESVIVCGNGTMTKLAGTDIKAIEIPSYTTLDVRGTIRVEDDEFLNYVPLRCDRKRDVDIPNVRIEGSPRYSIWILGCENVRMGHVSVIHSTRAGLGVRIASQRGTRSRNVSLDYLYANKTGSHGLETESVDGLTVGTVKAVNTGESGALIQGEGRASIGTVDSVGASRGWAFVGPGGELLGHRPNYAALRFANNAGPGITVGKVIARGGARGIFCVTGGRGITIGEVDISGTESNAILIQNCQDVRIATRRGSVTGSDIRLASRDDGTPVNDRITVENLGIRNSWVNESRIDCAGRNVFRNNTLSGTALEICPGSDGGGNRR